MSKFDKILLKVLSGNSDSNINFESLLHLLIKIGFTYRIKGSHHIFTKDGIEEIVNLQPKDGKAKPYQVKQVRNILTENKLISDEP